MVPLFVSAELIGKRHAELPVARHLHREVLPHVTDTGIRAVGAKDVVAEHVEYACPVPELPAHAGIHTPQAGDIVGGLYRLGLRGEVEVGGEVVPMAQREVVVEDEYAHKPFPVEGDVVEVIILLPHAESHGRSIGVEP